MFLRSIEMLLKESGSPWALLDEVIEQCYSTFLLIVRWIWRFKINLRMSNVSSHDPLELSNTNLDRSSKLRVLQGLCG